MTVKDFWLERQKMNVDIALPYQWDMYEECGTIDNFRIAAGLKDGIRRGFFYTDSDLHKWADAVCRTLSANPSDKLQKLLREYIKLMEKAQDEDGYIYTYNQIWFPGRRWENLLVEHELYCQGHFIEAGIEHAEAVKNSKLLKLVQKSADLICRDFDVMNSSKTPGHQEIEVALIRLYRLTGNRTYLEMGREFLSKRGKGLLPGLILLKSLLGHTKKAKYVAKQIKGQSDTSMGFDFTETTHDDDAPFIKFRFGISFLTGQYQQQHKPIAKQDNPRGHAVRWAYQNYAAVMADREEKKEEFMPMIKLSWDNLVSKKIYVTGGIGSLPMIEGFGRDFELNDNFAYCETCAAIGNIFLNDELFMATGSACYPDLLEWQLYNAASVGIGSEGKSYFYRNPLYSDGSLTRRPWFDTACCPSNISRLWATIDRYCLQSVSGKLYLNQFFTGTYTFKDEGIIVKVKSGFPHDGKVQIDIKNSVSKKKELFIRIPGWSKKVDITVSKKKETVKRESSNIYGITPLEKSSYYKVTIPPKSNIVLKLEFDLSINVILPWSSVKTHKNRFSITRGPLVYCLESSEDTVFPFHKEVLKNAVFKSSSSKIGKKKNIISIVDINGKNHELVPYFSWTSDSTGMRVWLLSKK